MSYLDLSRLVLGAAFLGVAAVSDFRTRTVKDRLWIAMGTVGLVLFGVDLYLQSVDPVAGIDPVIGLVLVPAAVLMYDPLIGSEFRTDDGWKFPLGSIGAFAIALGSTAFAVWDVNGDRDATNVLLQYLTVPIMMLVFRGMYEVHLLKGGADAKGMIVLAAFVPQYPALPPFPLFALGANLQDAMRIAFPFSLLILLNAALLLALGPVVLLVYNATRGHAQLPMALVGYKVHLDRVPSYAWFIDQIIDGEHVRVYFPAKRQDRAAITRDLRGAGFREAWVTPQLPFIVPVAVAYVFSFVVGNPLIGLLQALVPGR